MHINILNKRLTGSKDMNERLNEEVFEKYEEEIKRLIKEAHRLYVKVINLMYENQQLKERIKNAKS